MGERADTIGPVDPFVPFRGAPGVASLASLEAGYIRCHAERRRQIRNMITITPLLHSRVVEALRDTGTRVLLMAMPMERHNRCGCGPTRRQARASC